MEREPDRQRHSQPDSQPLSQPHAGADSRVDVVDDETVDPTELLLSRVVGAEESDAEWTAFMLEADRAPTLWRELACGQRDARRLSSAVEAQVSVAGRAAIADAPRDRRGSASVDRWSRSLGWAVAACVMLAWGVTAAIRIDVGAARSGDPTSLVAGLGSPVQPASLHSSLLSSGAPTDAFLDAYLDAGRRDGVVVGELPTKYLLESRPLAAGGGFEVLFVRPIVERRVVSSIYGFEADTDGAAWIVPVGDGAL